MTHLLRPGVDAWADSSSSFMDGGPPPLFRDPRTPTKTPPCQTDHSSTSAMPTPPYSINENEEEVMTASPPTYDAAPHRAPRGPSLPRSPVGQTDDDGEEERVKHLSNRPAQQSYQCLSSTATTTDSFSPPSSRRHRTAVSHHNNVNNSLFFPAAPMVSRLTAEYSNTGEIGKGSFGSVVAGTFDLDGQQYAIKQTSKAIQGEGDLQHRLQEAYAAAVCNNAHLLRYFDCWVEDRTLFLKSEWCKGGNIRRIPPPWRSDDICTLIRHISIAIHWMHASNMAHLDVKPENIFAVRCSDKVTGGDAVMFKLGDFGLARRIVAQRNGEPSVAGTTPECHLQSRDTSSSGIMPTSRSCITPNTSGDGRRELSGSDGTPPQHFKGENDEEGDYRYLCPVMLQNFGRSNEDDGGASTASADVYALGASCVELTGGDPSRVRFLEYGPNFDDRTLYPNENLRKLILDMTDGTPSKRPTAFEVLERVITIQCEISSQCCASPSDGAQSSSGGGITPAQVRAHLSTRSKLVRALQRHLAELEEEVQLATESGDDDECEAGSEDE